MRIPIKSKLVAGVTFLFVVILILDLLAVIFINRLSSERNEILKDNYNSLIYCNEMLKSLDNFSQDKFAVPRFDLNLEKQENNITEPGEAKATQQLRYFFSEIKKNPADTVYFDDARKQIYTINQLNQGSIQKKNILAQKSSKSATAWLLGIATLLTVITFSFIVNFPGYIANPIKILTEGIKEIANKNYDKRIYFKSTDEFGELSDAFNAMAAKLDEYEHSNLSEVMFEKQRIETIIGQMNDAIIGLDVKKNILFINSIAESLISLKAKEVIGKYAPDVALKNDLFRNLLMRDEKENLLKIVVEGKENFFTKEYRNVMSGEEIIGEVIVLKNITYFKELDVTKTNFIATISHELKTPISSIKMSLKLLNDERIGKANEEQKQLLQNIGDDAERLLKITGELLDLTQIESGKIQLHQQKVSPKEIIDVAVDATETQAQQRKISLEIKCDEALPMVEADAEKTSWVLINLISNAIRYSPENQKVIISAMQKDNTIIFSVNDFGKGIDKKYQQHLFSRYFRVPGEQEISGSGLGLAISKDFIEAQGGTIWLESPTTGGSNFSFSLNAVLFTT